MSQGKHSAFCTAVPYQRAWAAKCLRGNRVIEPEMSELHRPGIILLVPVYYYPNEDWAFPRVDLNLWRLETLHVLEST